MFSSLSRLYQRADFAYTRLMDIDKDTNIDLKGTSPEGRPIDLDGSRHDPEMEGLTLYEKKALIVNRELDSHGMGKYQWYIFFLCGFGYLIDLLYAQAFGLVVPAMQQEFGFNETQSGNIFSSFSAGLCAGVIFSYVHFWEHPY